MTVLLEMKERLKLIYSKGEPLILPIVKFLLAFLTLNTLNGRMGYMTQLDNVAVVLIAALTCSFLPVGALVFFAAVFSLIHMYALSLEVALVGLCVYLVMYLLFFRFSPKGSLVVVMTPLLCAFKIPYVVPVVTGLLCGPMSMVSVACGVVVYYWLEIVTGNASNIRTMGDDEFMAKVRMLIESIMTNKAMLVVAASFAITVLVVYLIRRMSVAYAWTIAMVAGAMIDVAALLVGDLLYDINISVTSALLGSLLAVLAAKVVEFFRFCVDYSRTEKVQFEDDEYYYYVKAIPKMAVPVPAKTVKKINAQQVQRAAGAGNGAYQDEKLARPVRSSGREVPERTVSGRNTGADRAPSGRSAGTERVVSGRNVMTERTVPRNSSGRSTGTERAASGRNVTTERTASRPGSGRNMGAERSAADRGGYRTNPRPQGRSNVTIGSTVRQDTVENVIEDTSDDYEELF